MHEAQMHEDNSFITLTYNDEHLPKDKSLHKEDLQKFFKRLRKRGIKFKYYACGEYGDENFRPHMHIIIFGYSFPDKTPWKIDKGNILYRSKFLEEVWTAGYSLIGDCTFETCAYVARYVMKKRKGEPDERDPITGKTNEEYYLRADEETGEMFRVLPEFCIMSRGSGKKTDPTLWRYGIGRAWYEQFKGDTEKDYITINYQKVGLPKYYDQVLAQEDELELMRRKKKRRYALKQRADDNTPERLDQRERVAEAKLKFKTRDL